MSFFAWLRNKFSAKEPPVFSEFKNYVKMPEGNSIPEQIFKREQLFESMFIRDNIVDKNGKILVSNIPQKSSDLADKIISNKDRYETVAHSFSNPIRWFHIGLIHLMEGEGNFNTYLGNGQSLNKVTTIVPKGRGPFASFEEGAIDAIELQGLDKVQDWSIGNTLYILEKYNGLGYSNYKGINSPYLWSGSNQYTAGKYISDGASGYSSTAISTQIGIALVLRNLIDKGVTDY